MTDIRFIGPITGTLDVRWPTVPRIGEIVLLDMTAAGHRKPGGINGRVQSVSWDREGRARVLLVEIEPA